MQMSVPFRALVALAMLAGTSASHAEPVPAAQAVVWSGKAPEQVVTGPESTQAPAPAAGRSEPSAYSLVLAGIGAAGWLARRRWRDDR